jgi:hypothetical protein
MASAFTTALRPDIFSPATLKIPSDPIAGRCNDEEILASDEGWAAASAKGVQPYLKGVGFRAYIDADMIHEGRQVGEGYYDFVKVTDGLFARVFDAQVHAPIFSRTPGDDWLKIDLCVSGRETVVFEEFGQVDLEQTWCNVHLHPIGVDKGEWMPNGVRAQGVVLYVHRDFLTKHLGPDRA